MNKISYNEWMDKLINNIEENNDILILRGTKDNRIRVTFQDWKTIEIKQTKIRPDFFTVNENLVSFEVVCDYVKYLNYSSKKEI